MLCPRCGKNTGTETVEICDDCLAKEEAQELARAVSGTQPIVQPPVFEEEKELISDGSAGFWLRFVAFLVDYYVVYFLTMIVGGLFFATVFGVSLISLPFFSMLGINGQAGQDLFGIAMIAMFLGVLLLIILVNVAFFALFESSSFQGSPGKIAMGLIVVNKDNQRIDVFRAAMRNFLKILPWLLCILLAFAGAGLGIGILAIMGTVMPVTYLMIAFSPDKRALHDMGSGCYVDKNADVDNLRRILVAGLVIIFVLATAWISPPQVGNGQRSMEMMQSSFDSMNELPIATSTGKVRSASSYSQAGKVLTATKQAVLGRIDSAEFEPDQVFIEQGSILKFRQGSQFFPDLSITVFLFENGDLSGRSFNASTGDYSGVPHIHVSYKVPGKSLPKTEIITDRYMLRLKFDKRKADTIQGEIMLEIDRDIPAKLRGRFIATYKGK